MIVTFEPEC